MSTIVSNLYPPIVENAMPSFIRTQSCKVYFSLSNYNTIEDIKNVQVTVVNQKTNRSALKSNLYPSGIKLTQIHQDQNIQNEYKYYIIIPPSDIIGNIFAINQFYMVQLRFTSIEATDPPEGDTAALNTWLYENRDYFSEWSTICLIKGIVQPLISINGFRDDVKVAFSNSLMKLVGRMYYSNSSAETEYLKSFKFKIYEKEKNSTIKTLVYQSNEIYTNSYKPNEFNYNIPYDISNTKIDYILEFTYITNNKYTQTKNYEFAIIADEEELLDIKLTTTPNPENGSIKIYMDFSEAETRTNRNLIIKRTSSKTNFTIWENIKLIPNNNSCLKHIFYDTSIESGIWYKYCIQVEYPGVLGAILRTKEPVMCVFEDMFLTNGNKQLKIQFNPTVTATKYNVMESQQITLGSTYPFIKRNGNTYYRTFTIGGLICSLIDSDTWYDPHFQDGSFHNNSNITQPFTSMEEIYGNFKDLYNQYNIDNNITIYQNQIYEKDFREKVIDFLYKNNIKLFRSATQGNILVKLMDISLEPMNELGRRLYSFSANAIEIADLTADNYKKYNIINKNYHTYKQINLQNLDLSKNESIITKIKQELSTGENIQYIESLTLQTDDEGTFSLQVKRKDASEEYTLSNEQPLILAFNIDNPIEDCYFSTAININLTCRTFIKGVN